MALTPTYYAAASEGGSTCFDGAFIWTAHHGGISGTTLTLQKFDPVTGAELQNYAITVTDDATSPGDLMSFAGSLWFIESVGHIAQIDPATGALLNEFLISTAAVPSQLLGTGCCNDGSDIFVSLVYFDGANFQIAVSKLSTAGVIAWTTPPLTASTNSIQSPVYDAAGGIWVTAQFIHELVILDHLTGAILNTVPMGAGVRPFYLFADSGFVYVTAPAQAEWFRVDIGSLAVSGPYAIPASRFPFNPIVFLGLVWIASADFGSNTVWVNTFDPATGAVTDSLMTTFSDNGLMASETVSGRVWLPGVTSTPTPFMLAIGAAAAAGQFIGTHVGFMHGQFSGGTK